MGTDNTIRSIRIRTRKSVIEKPIQNSKVTTSNNQDDKTLNVKAEKFQPKRSAVAVAEQRIRDIVDNKNQ